MTTRNDHIKVLDYELKTQSDNYMRLITQKALALLEQEEVFTGKFMKIEGGILMIKMKAEKAMPRKGQFLTAVILNDTMRSFKNWGNISWADLRKNYQVAFSESVCVWHRTYQEKGFLLAGFKNISLDFCEKIVEDCLITFGPKEPPLVYLQNLITLVKNIPENHTAARFLDFDIVNNEWQPEILNDKSDINSFLQSQLSISGELIIQGPPGTGKTYLVAKLISELLTQNKSILATSLTNRSLVEIASKPFLDDYRHQGRIYKTNLTSDEASEVPGIRNSKDILTIPGSLMLSTFYISSGFASTISGNAPFDYVIMDEASQGLLAMFAAVKKMGSNCIFIGDPFQLPPVVEMNLDKIKERNALHYIEGFEAICKNMAIPSYQLYKSFRLPDRGTRYTGIFYNNHLKSAVENNPRMRFPECGTEINKYLHPDGGPVLIKMVLPVGKYNPEFGLYLIVDFIKNLLNINEKNLSVAILSKTRKTVRAVQKAITASFGSDERLLVDTVERIQGLTCDIVIFFIPNTSAHHSLKRSLFNVATSRARRHTVIIADKSIMNYPILHKQVKTYLDTLDKDFSFEIEPNINFLKEYYITTKSQKPNLQS